MKEKAAKLGEIVQEYNREKDDSDPELFFDFFVNPEIHMRLIIGPIDAADGITHLLAKKIAKKKGVTLASFDFSKDRWSEPRDYRPVFYLDLPDDERQFKSFAKKLCEASKELENSTKRIVENLGYEQ
jgi:hypothetical protein